MSYRCQLCRRHVPHGQLQIKHTIMRFRKDIFGKPTAHTEIAKEIPVCVHCKQSIVDDPTILNRPKKQVTVTNESLFS